jgi:hypothetical protein
MPTREHKQVKFRKRGECVCYKGLRLRDRPQKRLALYEIAANQGRKSSRHESQYGCKECDVHLCKERGYFDVFHR